MKIPCGTREESRMTSAVPPVVRATPGCSTVVAMYIPFCTLCISAIKKSGFRGVKSVENFNTCYVLGCDSTDIITSIDTDLSFHYRDNKVIKKRSEQPKRTSSNS